MQIGEQAVDADEVRGADPGAVLEQETKISVTNCPKAKKAKVKHHKKHGKGKKK